MTSRTKIIGGVILALIVLGAGIFAWRNPNVLSKLTGTEAAPLSYENSNVGVSFKYPPSYQLQERDLTINNQPVRFITLAQTVDVPQNSEGPTAMTVAIFTLPAPQDVRDFLRSMQTTTPEPQGGFKYEDTTVGGQPAVKYQATGLYESDNVAVSRGNRVYVFSVTWLSREDTIVADFGDLLQTVSFGF